MASCIVRSTACSRASGEPSRRAACCALPGQGWLVRTRSWTALGPLTDPRGGRAPAEPVDFISYPYEWTFGQLRDAALLTLDLQVAADAAGFTLRDRRPTTCSSIEAAVLIDTLVRAGQAGRPVVAYRQFCEHFLAPSP
jgi:hypothetical protein